MAVDWQPTTLGELGVLRNGVNFSRHDEGLGIPILKVKDFVDEFSVPQTGLDELDVNRFTPHEEQMLVVGDCVIIRSNGNSDLIGRTLFFLGSPRPTTFTGFCIRFRPNPKRILPRFAAYFLRSPICRQRFSAYGSGTGIQNLNQDIISNLPIDLPSLSEQRRIADVLGSLDDKIEVNRKVNETLGAMAQMLFRSWFVDFDPVRAKANGAKEFIGMAASSFAALPSTFVGSPLGSIPTAWHVAPIGEYVEVAKGLSYKGSGLAESGVPLHNLNSVYEGGGYKHEGLKHYLGEYRPIHVVHPGDVIVANTEQGHDHLLIGYSSIVPKRYGTFGLFTHHLYRVRPLPGSPVTPPFIHFLLLDPRFRGEVTGYTNGTTVNMLSADGLKRPLFVLPPADLLQQFTEAVTPLLQRAEANYDESQTLAALRDMLLPKLLSGEIRVKEAEKVLSQS